MRKATLVRRIRMPGISKEIGLIPYGSARVRFGFSTQSPAEKSPPLHMDEGLPESSWHFNERIGLSQVDNRVGANNLRPAFSA